MIIKAENVKENAAIAGLFLLLALLTIWLQFGLLVPTATEVVEPDANDADYYATHIVLIGRDDAGQKYRLRAERMAHYPVGDRALLDNPYIIQHEPEGVKRHIYAESGWLYDNQTKVMLTGNVKVIQRQAGVADKTSTSNRMLVDLKKK